MNRKYRNYGYIVFIINNVQQVFVERGKNIFLSRVTFQLTNAFLCDICKQLLDVQRLRVRVHDVFDPLQEAVRRFEVGVSVGGVGRIQEVSHRGAQMGLEGASGRDGYQGLFVAEGEYHLQL